MLELFAADAFIGQLCEYIHNYPQSLQISKKINVTHNTERDQGRRAEDQSTECSSGDASDVEPVEEVREEDARVHELVMGDHTAWTRLVESGFGAQTRRLPLRFLPPG